MAGYGEKAGPVASYPGMKPQACREAGRTMGGMVSVQGGPAVPCMVFFGRQSGLCVAMDGTSPLKTCRISAHERTGPRQASILAVV